MLELLGLEKSFGASPGGDPAVPAVKAVDLRIAEGEFFSLLGPSGCGKTTLLRMLGGFEAPSRGQIRQDGRRIDILPANQRQFNMVFQRYALFPHLSVWENVAFGLRMKRTPPAELKTRVEEMLGLVKLTGMESRSVTTLSGGQQQRVALARALVNRPRVLLLDEPLSALDLKLRQQMQVELKAIQRRLGHIFIFVTHDQEEALTLSDRIAVMNAGVIEQVGSPEEIYENPRTEFVARFIGSINSWNGTVSGRQEDHLTVQPAGPGPRSGGSGEPARIGDTPLLHVRPSRDGSRGLGALTAGTSVTLLIRPEKIRISLGAVASGEFRGDLSDRENRVTGIVREILYQGAATQFMVDTSLGPIQVSQPNTALQSSADFEVSSPVELCWSARDCVWLESSARC